MGLLAKADCQQLIAESFPNCFGCGYAALCRVRVGLTGVLLDQRPSPPLSADEFPPLFEWFIGLCRCVTPRGRTHGPCGSAFARRPPAWLTRRCLRGLPVLVLEVSRRAWGLRLRRTKRRLALSSPFMLPSAHYKGIGVRIASFRS
jgi:hypothetical protein